MTADKVKEQDNLNAKSDAPMTDKDDSLVLNLQQMEEGEMFKDETVPEVIRASPSFERPVAAPRGYFNPRNHWMVISYLF